MPHVSILHVSEHDHDLYTFIASRLGMCMDYVDLWSKTFPSLKFWKFPYLVCLNRIRKMVIALSTRRVTSPVVCASDLTWPILFYFICAAISGIVRSEERRV